MNKIILFIIIVLCINIFYVKAQECSGRVDDEEKCFYKKTQGSYTHCCYFEPSDENGYCKEITDDQYENIKKYKDYMRTVEKDEDLEIDCSSGFLTFSVLSLIALLF